MSGAWADQFCVHLPVLCVLCCMPFPALPGAWGVDADIAMPNLHCAGWC